MASANEELFDAAIRHQIGLLRFASATVRKIIALLNRVDADLIAQIERRDPDAVSGAWSAKRIDAMLDAVRRVNRKAYEQVGKTLKKELVELAEYEVEFQKSVLGQVLPVKFSIVGPTSEMLKAAVDSRPFQGKLLKEWVKGLEDGRFSRLRDAIRIGFVEGETIDQIVRRVRGTKALQFKDGVLEISRRSAEAMVRTAVNHTATQAREDLYQQNEDLIKGVRWVSTLDMRTTAVCRARDGKVYPLDGGPRPPAHIGCRSTTVPVTKSWRELGIDLDEAHAGTRASMDGQVPGDVSYNDWLRKQSAEFQDEVLGPTKAKLFRSGGLTMDRFVDPTGHEYTLDELRKREAAAFEKAGLAA